MKYILSKNLFLFLLIILVFNYFLLGCKNNSKDKQNFTKIEKDTTYISKKEGSIKITKKDTIIEDLYKENVIKIEKVKKRRDANRILKKDKIRMPEIQVIDTIINMRNIYKNNKIEIVLVDTFKYVEKYLHFVPKAAISYRNKIVTGSFNISNSDDDTKFFIAPYYGYFFNQGLAIGGIFQFGNISKKDYSQTDVKIGPKLMYFFDNKKITSLIGTTYPYFTFSCQYSDATKEFKLSGISEIRNGRGIIISLGLGITHMITNTAGFFVETFYEKQNITENNGELKSDDIFNINGGISVFLY